MTLEARRKNQGKQYSVVSTADRTIRYWHKPGDRLPVMLTHACKDYILTKEVVEEARINQRSKLVVLTVDASGEKLIHAPSKLRKLLTTPVAKESCVTRRGGEYTKVTPVDSEINWKAVAWVVSSIFALACLATVTALGA